jgi:hypothetical protein
LPKKGASIFGIYIDWSVTKVKFKGWSTTKHITTYATPEPPYKLVEHSPTYRLKLVASETKEFHASMLRIQFLAIMNSKKGHMNNLEDVNTIFLLIKMDNAMIQHDLCPAVSASRCHLLPYIHITSLHAIHCNIARYIIVYCCRAIFQTGTRYFRQYDNST